MKWFKHPKDLYELLLLEDLYYGNAGHFVTRVPGGWIFTHKDLSGNYRGTFVPYSDEFKHLSDEEIQSMENQELEEGPGETKIGHGTPAG